MNLFGKIKEKLLAIEASPKEVSKGYALGVFLGTTPFVGTKVFIALGLTSFFRWSRIASIIGVYHINILTAPLFYSGAFWVGKLITGAETNLVFPQRISFQWLITNIYECHDVLKALLFGGLVLGIPLAVAAYYLSLVLLKKSIRRKDEKEKVPDKMQTANKKSYTF